MSTEVRKRTVRNLVIFAVSVLAIAALAGMVEPHTIPPGAEPGATGLGQLLWIVAPLGVSLLLRLFGGDGWSDFGLRPNFRGNGFWWLVSILALPTVIAVGMLVGLLSGGLSLDMTRMAVFPRVLLSALAVASVKNVFEEFAWRGYLAPKLYSLNLNIWLSHAIVGLIWGAWHLPFAYVFWTYLTPDLLWYFVPLLLVGTISQSVVYGEIRLATDSVLPAWAMHTAGNTVGNALFLSGLVRFTSPGTTLLFSPGAEGVLAIVLMFAIGYWLHRRRRSQLVKPSSASMVSVEDSSAMTAAGLELT
jgi:membrane protease YdiL (CAAX protease family)